MVYVRKDIPDNRFFEGGGTVVDRKLELVFVDKDGKFYPPDEVSRVELAEGFEKIAKEIARRLVLQKEQR